MALLGQLKTGIRKGSLLVSKARLLWRRRAWRAAGFALLVVVVPAGSWLLGTGVVSMAPHTYCSTAMVRLPSSLDNTAMNQERERIRSSEVLALAVRSLSGGRSKAADPMEAYLLWTNLEARNVEGANDICLAVRGADAASAQLKLEAIVNAYQEISAPAAGAAGLAYVSPPEAYQIRVSDEVRMVLGIAGFAGLAMILSIPLLSQIERFTPRSMTA